VTPFEAKASRWRVLLLLAGALGFVAVSIWLLQLDPPTTKRTLVAWAGIILFGAFFLIGLPRLFQQGVVLRIDAHGVWWRQWSDQTIPWSAIERISVGKIQRQRFACLFLSDPQAFPSTTLQGKLARTNKAMGFGDVALNTSGTDQSFDAMMTAITQFAPTGLLA
jgi:hypothetical protein